MEKPETNDESQNTGEAMTSNENKRALVMDALRLLRLETSPMEDGVARIVTIGGLSEAADAILQLVLCRMNRPFVTMNGKNAQRWLMITSKISIRLLETSLSPRRC